MTKYILQLLALLPFSGSTGSTIKSPKITASKPLLVMQIMERKAAERKAAAAQIAIAQREATRKPPVHKAAVPVRPSVAKPAPKKAVPVATHKSLPHIMVELDKYVDCVFSCIKNFLSPNDKRKLSCFAREIDACVKNLDNNVLKPLESMKNSDPTAAQLYQLAIVLKHNQQQFRNKITGGYKNAMSLGMALLGLKDRAVKDVNKALAKATPCLAASHLGSQFAPIKTKIVALTNYGTSPMQAIKVLGNRF